MKNSIFWFLLSIYFNWSYFFNMFHFIVSLCIKSRHGAVLNFLILTFLFQLNLHASKMFSATQKLRVRLT